MEMKKINLQKKRSLRVTALRLVGMNKGFEEALGNKQEIVHAGIPRASHYCWKEIETAWFEAEQKKAEIIAYQRHHLIC